MWCLEDAVKGLMCPEGAVTPPWSPPYPEIQPASIWKALYLEKYHISSYRAAGTISYTQAAGTISYIVETNTKCYIKK